ncbi:signal peptidase I [Streptomyces sp. NPDC052109]|uniref:signal peptidase I n=1 Tax=Streptomyces sp. NPDC052109 TaxID=3155527 RepID=UPI00344402E1
MVGAGPGRGLGIAALVVGLLGLVLGIGTVVYANSAYGTGTVPSESMSPTYTPGQRVVWEKVGGGEVRRGDVVVFSAPGRYASDGVVMQRVIAVGGDRVACCTRVGSEERVTVNGAPIEEPYVSGGDADGQHRSYDVRVPQGRLFLLGDHRADAMDSRAFPTDHGGTVPVDAVRGRVTEERKVAVALGTAVLLGAVLVLTGIGLGIGFLVVRRRKAPTVPQLPWPTRSTGS